MASKCSECGKSIGGLFDSGHWDFYNDKKYCQNCLKVTKEKEPLKLKKSNEIKQETVPVLKWYYRLFRGIFYFFCFGSFLSFFGFPTSQQTPLISDIFSTSNTLYDVFSFSLFFIIACSIILITPFIIGFYIPKKKFNYETNYSSATAYFIGLILTVLILPSGLYTIYNWNVVTCNQDMIGGTCCNASELFPMFMCEDQDDLFLQQINYSIEHDEVTIGESETFMEKFNIYLPEGYYAVRNLKAGEIDVPLFMFASGENGEEIDIIVFYYLTENAQDTIETITEDYMTGLYNIKNSDFIETTEPKYYQHLDMSIAEFNGWSTTQGSLRRYLYTAIILHDGEVVTISYAAEEPYYSYYIDDFKKMVEYITFLDK